MLWDARPSMEQAAGEFSWGLSGPLRIGTDFSGLNTPVLALKILQLPMIEQFVCDNDNGCIRLLAKHYPSCKVIYGDIAQRNVRGTPATDIYCTSFPCQPFSKVAEDM